MSEPHVLRHDRTNSSRANTYSVAQLPGGTWELSLYVQFGSATPFHATVYAHLPYADGRRRLDPYRHPCLLLSRVSEDVFRLESVQLHPSAPRERFDLVSWPPPPDEAA